MWVDAREKAAVGIADPNAAFSDCQRSTWKSETVRDLGKVPRLECAEAKEGVVAVRCEDDVANCKYVSGAAGISPLDGNRDRMNVAVADSDADYAVQVTR